MLEHVKCETPDLAKTNLEKLKALFPGAVTEGPNGVSIDVEALKQECSATPIEGNVERYEFTWPGKRAAKAAASAASSKTLRPCREESVDFDKTENLYIEGDNLEVLKLLQKNYANQVKMIYIDPPYNTGKDFVYRDRFSLTDKELATEGGVFDEDGNRFEVNDSAEARYHSNWCSMMYPRLKLARQLLSSDGVLFMSIDDNEVVNARKLCDEVFGEKNVLGQIVLKTATDNNGSQVVTEHEYMLCLSKNSVVQSKWKRKSEASQLIIKQYEKLKSEGLSIDAIQLALRKWIKDNKSDLPQVSHYNNVDERGVYSSSGNSSNPHPGGYMFDIFHPVTKKPCPKPANGWRWPEKTFKEYADADEVVWGQDESTQPHIKKRIETAKESLRSLIYEDNRGTTKELADLFDGKKIFDNPKPHNVLERIADFASFRDSIVLDFFSGSASTAHAIMQLNAKDGGNRKFIMVQLPETCAEDSEAAKAGYKNICEIGKERIRRAGKKIAEELAEKRKKQEKNGDLFDSAKSGEDAVSPLDIGFRVLKLDSSSLNDTSATVSETDQKFVNFDRIKSDRSSEDLLFQMLLETHIPLSDKIERKTVCGNEVFFVSDTALLACLDAKVKMTTEFFIEIAKLKPGIAFFRDDAFADDSARTNLQQAFDQFSPSTAIKVI